MLVRDRSPNKRWDLVREFDREFVEHPTFMNVLDEMNDLVDAHGCKSEADNLCITGAPGAGKSTALRMLEAAHPREKDAVEIKTSAGIAICDRIPILAIEMPGQPTPKKIARELLKALGDPFYKRGEREDLRDRVVHFAGRCGVKVIPIDEAQRAVDRDGEVRSEDIAEFMKELHGMMNVSFLLFGMGRIRRLLDFDEQIDRRWCSEKEILPYEWGGSEIDPPQDRFNFMGILVALVENCPFPFADELDVMSYDCAKRFYYASRGLVGLLKKQLIAVVWDAVVHGEKHITRELLEFSYNRVFRTQKAHEILINPWGCDWSGQLPPALRHHSLLLASKQRRSSLKRKSARRTELVSALTKA